MVHNSTEHRCCVDAIDLAPGPPIAFQHDHCSLPTAVTTGTLAFKLALRQPVICLPILSVNSAKYACFFKDRIFRSPDNRISSPASTTRNRLRNPQDAQLCRGPC